MGGIIKYCFDELWDSERLRNSVASISVREMCLYIRDHLAKAFSLRHQL